MKINLLPSQGAKKDLTRNITLKEEIFQLKRHPKLNRLYVDHAEFLFFQVNNLDALICQMDIGRIASD